VTITNRKNISIAIITIILLFAAIAGCFGGDDNPKPPTVTLEEYSETQSMSGWLDSEGGGNPSTVSHAFELNLNSSKLSYVKVTVNVDDYDAANAGSDEGSDPDEFTVKINSSGFESKTVTGTTPGSAILEIPAANATAIGEESETPEFGPDLTIMLDAVCNGGAGAFRPGNIVPPFIILIDQGITYSINVEYKYFEDPNAASEPAE
jgi:hypothetical protein